MYEGGSDNTVTRTTITNGTINLNKDTAPTETSAEALGINTDLSKANKQVEAPKDIGRLLNEQKAIQKEAEHINAAANTYVARQQKEAKQAEAQARKEAEEAGKAGDYQTAERKRREKDSR